VLEYLKGGISYEGEVEAKEGARKIEGEGEGEDEGEGDNGDRDGSWYPLWVSSLCGRDKVVEYLLTEMGASPDAMDERDGETAVSVASQKGHVSVLQMLIAKGASVNLAKYDGVSPLLVGKLGIQPVHHPRTTQPLYQTLPHSNEQQPPRCNLHPTEGGGEPKPVERGRCLATLPSMCSGQA
jgi:hypothetical protein